MRRIQTSETAVQSVIVSKKRMTLKAARAWIDSHGYRRKKEHATKETWRYRQLAPKKGARYRNYPLSNGVTLVLMY